MAEQGLRERKKQATRRMISDVATGLFVRRGFDAVTVAEIADAAGVSKMTVFNYFPRRTNSPVATSEIIRRVACFLRSRSPCSAMAGIILDQILYSV